MKSNPRGDKPDAGTTLSEEAAWTRVLAHRRKDSPATVNAVIERFRAAGVTPLEVESNLEDAGDRLYQAAASE